MAVDCGLNLVSRLLNWSTVVASVQIGRDLRGSLAQPPLQRRLSCEVRPELYPLGS